MNKLSVSGTVIGKLQDGCILFNGWAIPLTAEIAEALKALNGAEVSLRVTRETAFVRDDDNHVQKERTISVRFEGVQGVGGSLVVGEVHLAAGVAFEIKVSSYQDSEHVEHQSQSSVNETLLASQVSNMNLPLARQIAAKQPRGWAVELRGEALARGDVGAALRIYRAALGLQGSAGVVQRVTSLGGGWTRVTVGTERTINGSAGVGIGTSKSETVGAGVGAALSAGANDGVLSVSDYDDNGKLRNLQLITIRKADEINSTLEAQLKAAKGTVAADANYAFAHSADRQMLVQHYDVENPGVVTKSEVVTEYEKQNVWFSGVNAYTTETQTFDRMGKRVDQQLAVTVDAPDSIVDQLSNWWDRKVMKNKNVVDNEKRGDRMATWTTSKSKYDEFVARPENKQLGLPATYEEFAKSLRTDPKNLAEWMEKIAKVDAERVGNEPLSDGEFKFVQDALQTADLTTPMLKSTLPGSVDYDAMLRAASKDREELARYKAKHPREYQMQRDALNAQQSADKRDKRYEATVNTKIYHKPTATNKASAERTERLAMANKVNENVKAGIEDKEAVKKLQEDRRLAQQAIDEAAKNKMATLDESRLLEQMRQEQRERDLALERARQLEASRREAGKEV
jgi:hypothetical protein